jgi:molybdopterin converting factor small subunit
MRVNVRLFAGLRELLPNAERGRATLEVPEGSSLLDLIESLEIPDKQAQMVLVNGDQAPRRPEVRAAVLLKEDDTVAIFPPLAGG